jgi:hypothetical protein
MMTSLCTCVFLYVCALVLRFSSFALWNREARTQPWQHNGDQVGREFFFDIYFSKKEKRETLVADAEATPATAVVAFVLSMYYYDAQILSCFNPLLLSFSFHRPGFLFFSFLSFSSFFFFPHFSLFLLLSPWVMSNLRVLYI